MPVNINLESRIKTTKVIESKLKLQIEKVYIAYNQKIRLHSYFKTPLIMSKITVISLHQINLKADQVFSLKL